MWVGKCQKRTLPTEDTPCRSSSLFMFSTPLGIQTRKRPHSSLIGRAGSVHTGTLAYKLLELYSLATRTFISMLLQAWHFPSQDTKDGSSETMSVAPLRGSLLVPSQTQRSKKQRRSPGQAGGRGAAPSSAAAVNWHLLPPIPRADQKEEERESIHCRRKACES